MIRVICSAVSGNLSFDIQWFRNGLPINDRRSYMYTQSSFDYHSVLVLKLAAIDHGGEYACSAKNKAGTAFSNFKIQVKF